MVMSVCLSARYIQTRASMGLVVNHCPAAMHRRVSNWHVALNVTRNIFALLPTVLELWVEICSNGRQTITTRCLNNAVITTMVIGPLNGGTYCARSAFIHLGLWRKLLDCSLHYLTTSKRILKCALLTFSTTSNWMAEI